MNNLAVTDVLEIAVVGIAIVQALTIILTIRRERDIEELRNLVDQQRLRLIELTAWLAGRNSIQPRQIRSEREPTTDAKVQQQEVKSKDLPEAREGPTAEEEAARAEKTLNWRREVTARLQAGLEDATPKKVATTLDDFVGHRQPSTAQDVAKQGARAFNWFKEDPNEPSEIVEARKTLAGLQGGTPSSGSTIEPKDLPATEPTTAKDGLERAGKVTEWLKEHVDKAR